MNFITRASNYLALKLSQKYVDEKYNSTEDQIETHSYGFQVILGSLVKGISLIVLSTLLGILIPSLIIVLTFSSLRIIAGGYHAQTYNKCLIISLTMMLSSALIAQYGLQYWSYNSIYILLILTWVTNLYNIIRYIPRDTPTKIINKQFEINKFKRWALKYLSVWTIIMLLSLHFNYKLLVISSCFGMLLELFSVSKLGNKSYKILNM